MDIAITPKQKQTNNEISFTQAMYNIISGKEKCPQGGSLQQLCPLSRCLYLSTGTSMLLQKSGVEVHACCKVKFNNACTELLKVQGAPNTTKRIF